MDDILFIARFIADTLWQVWPAFLLSVLLGVLVRALKLDTVIRSAFGARPGVAVALATGVGAFSPFCSCSVVPIIRGLLVSGVPLAPVMAFWIASPLMDPEIFTLSVATLGWPLAVARLLATLTLSLGAGYLTLWLVSRGLLSGTVLREQRQAAGCGTPAPLTVAAAGPAPRQAASCSTSVAVAAAHYGPQAAPLQFPAYMAGSTCGGTCAVLAVGPAAPSARWAAFTESLRGLNWAQLGRDTVTQSWSLGRWLLLAFLLEALITLYVPQQAIASILGNDSIFAVPLAALIGVPLYVGNVTALPIVSGLLAQGMDPGAAIAFLIAGPVTTVPAMAAVWGIVQPRVVALYLGISLAGAVLLGLAASVLLG